MDSGGPVKISWQNEADAERPVGLIQQSNLTGTYHRRGKVPATALNIIINFLFLQSSNIWTLICWAIVLILLLLMESFLATKQANVSKLQCSTSHQTFWFKICLFSACGIHGQTISYFARDQVFTRDVAWIFFVDSVKSRSVLVYEGDFETLSQISQLLSHAVQPYVCERVEATFDLE